MNRVYWALTTSTGPKPLPTSPCLRSNTPNSDPHQPFRHVTDPALPIQRPQFLLWDRNTKNALFVLYHSLTEPPPPSAAEPPKRHQFGRLFSDFSMYFVVWILVILCCSYFSSSSPRHHAAVNHLGLDVGTPWAAAITLAEKIENNYLRVCFENKFGVFL